MPNDAGLVSAPMRGDVVDAALAGLTAARKTLPPRLFYDDAGCRLFHQITSLPEYYLTRMEMRLLSRFAAELLPPGMKQAVLVEFGASDETKARHFLDLRQAEQAVFRTYVPVDIAASELTAMQARLASAYPRLTTLPVVADFMHPIRLPKVQGPHFGFFPGSTIGNLDPADAVSFLRRCGDVLGRDAWFLLGADLRKNPGLVVPAYDDAAGVTAAFNLNLLTRLNREAAANFNLSAFRHQAIWNDHRGRIEMHLVSRHDQCVTVAGRPIMFAAGETIHTENSYKHTAEGMVGLARDGGWTDQGLWTDPDNLFGLFLFRRA